MRLGYHSIAGLGLRLQNNNMPAVAGLTGYSLNLTPAPEKPWTVEAMPEHDPLRDWEAVQRLFEPTKPNFPPDPTEQCLPDPQP